ncbi:hypothetical protein Hanom_Chr12g01134321 [Helianthus anomalus]
MGEEYLNNALICAVKRHTSHKVKEDDVMARFQAFKTEEEKSIRYVFSFIYYCVFIFVSLHCIKVQ